MPGKGFDLHVHSNFSDGTMSPEELAAHASRADLDGIAIADHDTIAAFPVARAAAAALSIQLIPAIEMSTEFQKESIHVLGYAYDPCSDVLKGACALHARRREVRNLAMVDRLQKKGFALTYDEVISSFPEARTYGRPHIAGVLVAKGYIGSIQEAFKKYLGSGKSCYVAGERWTTLEAVELIHQAGGFAVLAHPHLISRFQRVQELMKLPFDGIECLYASFPEEDNRRYLTLARARNLLITGGSDFHGANKPATPIGASVCPKDTVEIFLNRAARHG